MKLNEDFSSFRLFFGNPIISFEMFTEFIRVCCSHSPNKKKKNKIFALSNRKIKTF